MQFTNAIEHAKSFANHLESNVSKIHTALRKHQSKEVVDYEIKRSLDTLKNLSEIRQYFTSMTYSQETATFLPLNLPLYSFILFAAIPSYQSASLTLRAPYRLQSLFSELFERLSLGEHYPNVSLFTGSREEFLTQYCAQASVVIFTGKYKNFLYVRRACSKDSLILFNGVGHNPLVITPSANLDSVVEKTLQVKVFNNGQDCAGPDTILVHRSVIDIYLSKLLKKLAAVRCDISYRNDDVVIGPLFEVSSLSETIKLINSFRRKGATIVSGGKIDINYGVVYPCILRAKLRQLQNFTELYSPVFLVTEYDHDRELSLYFNDSSGRYQNNEMYISLFGESDFVTDLHGSIILRDRTVHDVERGTLEYGGYGPGSSSVSYQGLVIPKPLLIPREINIFLSPQGQKIFMPIQETVGKREQYIVSAQFNEAVTRIFGDQLVFAYIFGSFSTGKDKRYSDIDTLICVYKKQRDQIEKYLNWLFSLHEIFGRIPDFKYPAEIVSFADLQAATEKLATMKLSVIKNEGAKYDTMVWCHSLSQPWTGGTRIENIPERWKKTFPAHSSRLLHSLLDDLERAIIAGDDISHLHPELNEIPCKEPGISNYIENLGSRGLLSVLKMVPFEEKPVYTDIVLELVSQREFIGRELFAVDRPDHLYDPDFRFGVVAT